MRTIFNLTSFVRFLNRNRLFTAVNVFGFAISLMFVVLLGLYIQDEMSINASQPNKDRIFRLTTENYSAFSPPNAADLKNRFPEIEATMRTDYRFLTIGNGSIESINGEVFFVDSSFLTMFEIPFVEGNAASAMRAKDDILLSEAGARRLFGTESAMGKVVEIKNREMIVSGVFRDLKHTHFKTPDVISRFENLTFIRNQNLMTDYGHIDFGVYLMTYPNAELKLDDMKEFLGGFPGFFQFGMSKELFAEPLLDVYYNNTDVYLMPEMRRNDLTFLAMLGSTALLILLFAVINYINLSVAQAGFRAKEAAVRILLGGSKVALFAGFIIESLIVATVSLIFGIMLADLAGGWFQQVMWTEVSIVNFFTLTNIAIALGGVLVIGIVAGVMPATVLTRFKPIDVVRGTFRRKTKMVYSKVLIVFQYCITIVLLIATITIMRQLDFMKNSDMGFNKDNILMMDVSLGDNMSNDGLRNAISSVAGVKAVGFSGGNPIRTGGVNVFDYKGKNHSYSVMYLDSVVFNMMNFTILHRTGIADRNAVWLNEVAWNDFGLADDATEFRHGDDGKMIQIAGTIKDYHVATMDQPIGPTVIYLEDRYRYEVLVQISGTNPFEVADRVKKAYSDYNKGMPFKAKFADEHIQEKYAAQERMSWIIGVMSMLAILISALGLFAMSTYFARQKAQEVAVRKVFGATGGEVLTMLMSNFLKLVVIAIIIAMPIGWYFMRNWLSDYVYRVDLSWSIFAIAGLSALLVAAGTVLWQALRATRANPVKAIKD